MCTRRRRRRRRRQRPRNCAAECTHKPRLMFVADKVSRKHGRCSLAADKRRAIRYTQLETDLPSPSTPTRRRVRIEAPLVCWLLFVFAQHARINVPAASASSKEERPEKEHVVCANRDANHAVSIKNVILQTNTAQRRSDTRSHTRNMPGIPG